MGLFEKIFAKRLIKQVKTNLGTVDEISPSFSAFGKNFMQSEVFSSCINTNGAYASKLKVSSIRETIDGKISDFPEMDWLLQYRPNPTMNAATFYERVNSYYWIYANAFIYIERDNSNRIIAFWSIDPSTARFAQSTYNKEWFIKFTLNGDEITVPYNDIIHIARNVLENDMFGDSNSSILQVLSLINTNYQGIENAIKTSAVIRFMGEVSTKLDKKSLRKIAREFTEDYLKINTKEPVGIAMVDSLVKLTPITNNTQRTANFQEQNNFDVKVYRFLHCPEKIVASTATEDERIAYVDSALEPFMIKLAQEMTAKIFTKKEIGFKNRIKVEYDKLENMTMKTKLEYVNTIRELGVTTLGEIGDILGLNVPKEQRNKVLISQNYSGSDKQIGENVKADDENIDSDLISDVAEVTNKPLLVGQLEALANIIAGFQAGNYTYNQAKNMLKIGVGLSDDEATQLLDKQD